ncbi:hypothetical protein [Jiulongibacter sediminis]|jgi:membrane protease YdiL (CAAX protease family)|uniref:hypothetical protein n=1 Tax=Jiulongibacter sediminis TaxID=1605367 RepID=UPI0026ED6D31|nr:hypothetical protein [Jiulongibacter sediminis]
MTDVITKILKFVSFILVIIMLLLCYVQLPDSIAVTHNEIGRPTGFMDKQTFFYVGVAVIVGLYVLFGLLKSTLVKTNFSNLNPKSLWAQKPEQLKYLLGGWSDVFLTVINIYLLFTLLAIKETNGEASRNLFRNYDWFLIVGAIALIILIFFVPLRLLFTDPKE